MEYATDLQCYNAYLNRNDFRAEPETSQSRTACCFTDPKDAVNLFYSSLRHICLAVS